MELIGVFWCMFGLIIGMICTHLAYKGTEDDGIDCGDSERELDRDNDMRIYLPSRIRNRWRDHGRTKRLEPEEKEIVLRVILHDFSKSLSPGEKGALQEMIDDYANDSEMAEDPEEYIDGVFDRLDAAVSRFDAAVRKQRGE